MRPISLPRGGGFGVHCTALRIWRRNGTFATRPSNFSGNICRSFRGGRSPGLPSAIERCIGEATEPTFADQFAIFGRALRARMILVSESPERPLLPDAVEKVF